MGMLISGAALCSAVAVYCNPMKCSHRQANVDFYINCYRWLYAFEIQKQLLGEDDFQLNTLVINAILSYNVLSLRITHCSPFGLFVAVNRYTIAD